MAKGNTAQDTEKNSNDMAVLQIKLKKLSGLLEDESFLKSLSCDEFLELQRDYSVLVDKINTEENRNDGMWHKININSANIKKGGGNKPKMKM